jgi:hypothetical protein
MEQGRLLRKDSNIHIRQPLPPPPTHFNFLNGVLKNHIPEQPYLILRTDT